jgi:hypothetical protein
MSNSPDRFGSFLFLTIVAAGILITALLVYVTGDVLWISAYCPNKSIPAYHLIGEEDLTNISMFNLLPHEGVVQNRSKIVGKYAIAPISSGDVIKNSMLGEVPDGMNLNDTDIIGLVADSGMIFDGYLQSGDMIDIIMVPKNNDSASMSFNDTMLMDIKGCSNDSAQKTCIFVVALNRSEKERFFDSMRESDIRIVKVLSENKSTYANSG